MKSLLKRIKQKITYKDLPPPYSADDNADNEPEQRGLDEPNEAPVCEVLDLLANCKVAPKPDDSENTVAEYTEIDDMGLWHSTPLTHRHKSKISLTWVLKENLDNSRLSTEKLQTEERIKNTIGNDVDRRQRHNQRFNENEIHGKCKIRDARERVVGRNEYYHNLKFRSACDEFMNGHDTYSDESVDTEEYMRRKHRHRHRRKKNKQNGTFGYDIRDLDSFLSEATIDRPGNIPVVIAYPSTLYQTQGERQQELMLPLGTVVNAVFKNEQWLYAQTPHGHEGYVLYSACLPLGILPNRTSPQKKTPCWESSTDIYPRPCGNLTDNEKEQLRGRTRSECRYQARSRRKPDICPEKDFDSLYLKTKSVNNIDRAHEREHEVKRQTLLVVNSDYRGNVLEKTLSVQQGDVVVLAQGRRLESDVDTDWFYVKKKDGSHGYIPAVIAGHGYI
ncbi:uncharacterized protein LOC115443085 isoform X1 [Manduca sexta]|uniref:uncharacterized protein LOC115443085 isoform X1 n=2 Tax=Manduca sexta TaxID=7130 RepID=UPI001890A6CF|nr:uncharacterized protein LOC115443085 isoform X1 [Manduca sexta]